MATYGRVDAMVTAAGISYSNFMEKDEATDPWLNPGEGLILNKSTERWQKVLDVNLTGVMICAREAARQMIAEKHGGTIVNFASIAGYGPAPTIADYCVSEGRGRYADKVLGSRTWTLRHTCQCGGARAYRNRHDAVFDGARPFTETG